MIITLIRQMVYQLKVTFAWLCGASYCIRPGYIHRKNVIAFDDSGNQDEFQREVYLFAADFCKEHNITAVLDIGCGSAYKLRKYLFDVVKAGVEPDASNLKQQFPGETWFEFLDSAWKQFSAQLIICADVIEHVPNPDAFIADLLAHQHAQYFIFSTPDRNLDNSPWKYGPPNNESHYREWTFEEFEAYLGKYVHVLHHEISNVEQRTQLVVAKRR